MDSNTQIADMDSIESTTLSELFIAFDTVSYVRATEQYRDSIDRNIRCLKVHRQDVFDVSAEGGEIRVYTRNPDTVKLQATYYGETGKAQYDLYLKNSKTVFIKRKLSHYKQPIGNQPVIIDNVEICSFIMNSNLIVAGKRNGRLISNDDLAADSEDIEGLYGELLKQLYAL